MNSRLEKIISRVRNLKEAAPTNSNGVSIAKEEVAAVPTNNVGGGNVAGIGPGEEPPIHLKKRKKKNTLPTILARGRMGGSRKRWTT